MQLLRCGTSPDHLAGQQPARRKVALAPPLFAAQATKYRRRVLSYSQWPLAAAFVERNAAQWRLWRCSQSREVVSCGVALGCSSYLCRRSAR
jgi:hypothetical protein